MGVTAEQWDAVRGSLKTTGDRFVGLVGSNDPEVMATADWSVADVAAHVASIALMYTYLVREDDSEVPIPSIRERIPGTTVDSVAALNDAVLGELTERDTTVTTGQLSADIDEFLRLTQETDPNRTVTWLGDSQVPVAGLAAHLVNELLIHGNDIAEAVNTPWEMPERDAAQFFELFLTELTRHDVGHLLDNDEPARDRRIAVEFRSKYTSPVVFVLDNGRVSIEAPGGPVDARLSFAPATLNLVLFGRMSKLRAVLTRKIIISGSRPWLLPTFLRTFRLPS